MIDFEDILDVVEHYVLRATIYIVAIVYVLGMVAPASGQTFSEWGGPIAIRATTLSPVTVTHSLELGESATHVWIQVYNGSREHGTGDEKVAVRVNGGSWQPFTQANGNVDCDPIFDYYTGGCFNWKQGTYSFVLTQAFNSGSNTIDFRLTPATDAAGDYSQLSNNAYIMGFVALASDGQPATVSTDFTGEPVSNGITGNASNGAAIFADQDRAGVVDHPTGPDMDAACQDCHMTAGAHDLAQFQFSQNAIQDRCEWHGLSESECNDVVAYIDTKRTTLVNDDMTSHTPTRWPWDPPYQPGPGLAAGTSLEWLDGAGLEGVTHGIGSNGYSWTRASYDARKACVFPNGIYESAFEDPRPMIDMCRPFQWPTWSFWWPQVAGPDAFTGGTNSKYANMLTHFANAYTQTGSTRWNTLGSFSSEAHQLKNQGFVSHPDFSIAMGRIGVIGEATMRRLRMQHDLHINREHETFVTYKEDISYFTFANSHRAEPFDRAPHIVENSNQSNPYYYGDFNWYSMLWYDVAIVMNDGRGNTTLNATNPVDIGYTFGFSGSARDPFVVSSYLMSQARNLTICPPSDLPNAGSRPGYQGCAGVRNAMYFWWHYEMIIGDARFGDGMSAADEAAFLSLDIKYRTSNMTEWVRADYERADGFCYLDDINAAGLGATHAGKYYDESCNPALYKDGTVPYKNGSVRINWFRYYEPQLAFHMRSFFENAGVACEAIDAITAWGQVVYPNGDWSYTCTSGATYPVEPDEPDPDPEPTLAVVTPTGGSYVAGSTVDGSVSAFLVDSVLVFLQKNASTIATASDSVAVADAFSWALDGGLTPGSDYRFGVSTAAGGGLTAYSGLFTVTAAPPADSTEANVHGMTDYAWSGTTCTDHATGNMISAAGTFAENDYRGCAWLRKLHGYDKTSVRVGQLDAPIAGSTFSYGLAAGTDSTSALAVMTMARAPEADSVYLSMQVRFTEGGPLRYVTRKPFKVELAENDVCLRVRVDGGVAYGEYDDTCSDSWQTLNSVAIGWTPDQVAVLANARTGADGLPINVHVYDIKREE